MADPTGFLALALRVLAERLLTLLALLITAGLFAWAMWMQTVLACIIATLFGGVIFLPVLLVGRRRGADHAEDE
jgi:hypothetical protein